MSHKYYVSRIVHLAARNVWFKQMDGTWLPNIVVKLDLHAPKISLIAVTAGKPELSEPEEIAVFAGGKSMWRSMAKRWRAKYPDSYAGLSLAEVYRRHGKGCDTSDYAHIVTEIESALHHKGRAWLREHGLDPEYSPAAILTGYLRRGEVLPAAMLAHAILYPWSRHPGVYWSSFFHLCDRLLTYRHKRKGVNTAPHPAQFTQIISLCVANFSKELNRLTAEQFATKQPLPKIYLDIHTMLLRRLQSSCSNVTFTHVTHPRITAKLL